MRHSVSTPAQEGGNLPWLNHDFGQSIDARYILPGVMSGLKQRRQATILTQIAFEGHHNPACDRAGVVREMRMPPNRAEQPMQHHRRQASRQRASKAQILLPANAPYSPARE